ncbi:glycosyltransferase family 9 protein [candidate division WOR-3 bacterium]|nr:glycosyltransferase family 9 protein [candidate division WOR-3 bacterium]
MVQNKLKILASRTDGLGDLILTLPAIEVLKKQAPQSSLDFVVRNDLTAVTEKSPFIDRTFGTDILKNPALKDEKYDLSIMFNFEKNTAFLIRKTAKIRCGRFSKPLSFVLLNRGLRQKRSRAEKNEAQYNIDLVRHAFGEDIEEEPRPRVFFDLKQIQIPFDDFIVISPQMKGSAKNFDGRVWKTIAKLSANSNQNVVLTGENTDKTILDIKSVLGGKCHDLTGKTSLKELGYVLSKANLVIAPSTGTLHLANALGSKIFSIFPGSGSTSFARWHPWKYRGQILISEENGAGFLRVEDERISKAFSELI